MRKFLLSILLVLALVSPALATIYLGTDGWTLTDGQTYTFQKELTTEPNNYILENHSPMIRVNSIANCESTEKSFYWANDLIYIHATGGGDPTSNGKTYEIPTSTEPDIPPRDIMRTPTSDVTKGVMD